MNVHGPLEKRIRHLSLHDVQDAVDLLVAPGAQDRGAEDLLVFRSSAKFTKPSVSFDGSTGAFFSDANGVTKERRSH
jgi:hypothetical protein